MKRIITQTDKDAFLEFYFGWRAEGKNIRECYRLARQAYIAEGRDSVPSFSTLRRWLYPNASKKVKMTAGAESEEAGRKNMTADAESERAAWTPEVLTPDDRRKITEQMGYDFDIGSVIGSE